ncbi:MAG: hypothetical protein KBG28_06175 [Kofleriaceae bacterium]|nr:hypothetical protein [Kofleriaceae bacterium]
MKKCASCSKDLPDSAQHCVFCGAKQQAPAPAPGQAKTVMGYQASDVIKQMQQQASARTQPSSAPPPMGGPPPAAPPMGGPPPAAPPPAAANAPTMFLQNGPGAPAPMGPGAPAPMPMPAPMPQAAASHPGGQGGYGPPPGSNPPPMGAPSPGYATQLAQGGPGGYASQPNFPPAPSAPSPYGPPPGQGGYPPSYPAPSQPQFPHGPGMGPSMGPGPGMAPPPYLASQSAGRAAHPVEPFNEGLGLVMLVFGILLLGAFATPLTTEPKMTFWWNALADAPGKLKLEPIRIVGVGVLALVLGLIPLAGAARGLFAAVLGAALIAVPIVVGGAMPPWQALVMLLAPVALVPGLLLRHEYRESGLGRVLTTVGAGAIIALYVIPVDGGVPIVNLFKALGDNGAERTIPAVALFLLAVLSLLVWLPAPSSAGAKVFAWAFILFGVVGHVLALVGGRGFPDVIKAAPYQSVMAWVPGVAAIALLGYGLAAVLGKKLE